MPTVVRSQVARLFIFYPIYFSKRNLILWLGLRQNLFQAMGISSFVAGIGLLVFPYINSLVSLYITCPANPYESSPHKGL